MRPARALAACRLRPPQKVGEQQLLAQVTGPQAGLVSPNGLF